MKLYILAALVGVLSSCSLVESVKDTALKTTEILEEGREILAVAQNTLTDARAEFAEARAKADTDGDGKASMDEWIGYLLGLLGVGGAGGIALARSAVRNAKSDGRKTAMEDRINALEKTGS